MPQRTLELIVAEGCNLKCTYCFEQYKEPRTMDFATAKRAVDEHMAADDGYDELMIDFMGGEPMMAFPLIKKVVEYVTGRRWPKKYHFSMSTNGTLFTAKRRPWFVEHRRDFTPMLSFDGTQIAQNLNRSGSFNKVARALDFFHENWPYQPLKMTVDQRALPYLADGLFSILARGFKVDCNLVHDDVWGQGEVKRHHMRVLEYELARIVDFYTEFPTEEPPMLVNLPITSCLDEERDPRKPWCGAGDGMCAVGQDGKSYPCHRFMEFSAGRSMSMEQYHDEEFNVRESSRCEQCPMILACPTCQAHNWEHNGSITARVVFGCELHKLQMVATAAVHLNRCNMLLSSQDASDIPTDVLETMGRRIEASRRALEALADIPQAELKPYVDGDWPTGTNWEQRVRWTDRREHPAPDFADAQMNEVYIPLERVGAAGQREGKRLN